MHGSSSVPQELLAEIREFGGDMKETYGVPVEEIQEGIKHGVRKVNIDTDLRLAITGAIRRYLFENPSKFDPRDYLKPAREAAKEICRRALHAVRLRRPWPARSSRFRSTRSPRSTSPASLRRSSDKRRNKPDLSHWRGL